MTYERPAGICGKWMRNAREACARSDGHRGSCKTRAALDDDNQARIRLRAKHRDDVYSPPALRSRSRKVRSPAHASFASRVRLRMEARGWTRERLARELGVSATMVGYWRQGRYLPQPDLAIALAEALDDPRILHLVSAARTRRCPTCGVTYDREQTRALYCSADCQRRAHLKSGTPADLRQEAIDAMCRSCEPEGFCRDDSCALRPFSPLLFVGGRNASRGPRVA